MVSSSTDPLSGKENPFQDMLSRILSSAQRKEWSSESLIAAT
jgi:hypothetical protein